MRSAWIVFLLLKNNEAHMFSTYTSYLANINKNKNGNNYKNNHGIYKLSNTYNLNPIFKNKTFDNNKYNNIFRNNINSIINI